MSNVEALWIIESGSSVTESSISDGPQSGVRDKKWTLICITEGPKWGINRSKLYWGARPWRGL